MLGALDCVEGCGSQHCLLPVECSSAQQQLKAACSELQQAKGQSLVAANCVGVGVTGKATGNKDSFWWLPLHMVGRLAAYAPHLQMQRM